MVRNSSNSKKKKGVPDGFELVLEVRGGKGRRAVYLVELSSDNHLLE